MSLLHAKEISPSVLSADFGYLMRDINAVKDICNFIHVDVMDGHYVPNISMGIPVLKSIRRHSDALLDVHLMIQNPQMYIRPFAEAGADYITFHVECVDDPFDVIRDIRSLGKKAGVSIHPDTDISSIYPFLAKDAADLILIMSVRPGFGGQQYMPEATARIAAVREKLDSNGSDAILSVDGGINEKTILQASGAGAQLLVAGSAVFGADDITAAAVRLTSLANSSK